MSWLADLSRVYTPSRPLTARTLASGTSWESFMGTGSPPAARLTNGMSPTFSSSSAPDSPSTFSPASSKARIRTSKKYFISGTTPPLPLDTPTILLLRVSSFTES